MFGAVNFPAAPKGSDPAYDAYQDYFDQPVVADTPLVPYQNPHPISLCDSGLPSSLIRLPILYLLSHRHLHPQDPLGTIDSSDAQSI